MVWKCDIPFVTGVRKFAMTDTKICVSLVT